MKRIKYICKMGALERKQTLAFNTNTQAEADTSGSRHKQKQHTQATEDGRNTAAADCIHDDGTGSPDWDDGWLAGEVRCGR